jgi:hypothetical protein
MSLAERICAAVARIGEANRSVDGKLAPLDVLPETPESLFLLESVASKLECDAVILDRVINGWA